MDSIKIEILGNGAKVTVGELTDQQTNYIIAHQTECNKIVPLFDESFTVKYKNWEEVDDVCNLFGSTYKSGSEILLTVNGVTSTIENFNEDRRIVNIENDKNYILSISHVYGNILTFEFGIENFDESKISFLVDDLNSLLWGELIYGIKYDNIIIDSVSTSNEIEFENILFKNNTCLPIQKPRLSSW
jgi:hypothetical protein